MAGCRPCASQTGLVAQCRRGRALADCPSPPAGLGGGSLQRTGRLVLCYVGRLEPGGCLRTYCANRTTTQFPVARPRGCRQLGHTCGPRPPNSRTPAGPCCNLTCQLQDLRRSSGSEAACQFLPSGCRQQLLLRSLLKLAGDESH